MQRLAAKRVQSRIVLRVSLVWIDIPCTITIHQGKRALSVELDLAFFRSLADCDAANLRVQNRLAKMQSGEDVLRFFTQYAGWNGYFANGVAALASLIGDNRGHFQESGFARAVADRSNCVASFIFDAARDEYDDHISPLRDTHRCMAQASLISMAKFYGLGNEEIGRAHV